MQCDKKNVAIFISGAGSNMEALINACLDDTYPARIVCVISDNLYAQGLITAKNAGIQTYYINPDEYDTKRAYETILHQRLLHHKVDFICLAGFMRLLSSYLCDLWHHKMINIHPSLLPAFKGLNTHRGAIELGVKFAGCTVHYVSLKMDSGKIIAQAVTPVYTDDTTEILAKRVLVAEHKLYPAVLKRLCQEQFNEKVVDNMLSFYHTD